MVRDDDLRDDQQRGERSRDGFSDADDRRNPVVPNESGEPPHQHPESGRARDPELDNER